MSVAYTHPHPNARADNHTDRGAHDAAADHRRADLQADSHTNGGTHTDPVSFVCSIPKVRDIRTACIW